MLRVGIDITSTIYHRGVSRYTTNLVRGLLTSPKVRVSLYGSSLRQRQQLLQIAERLKKEAGNAKAETSIQAYPPSMFNFLWNKMHFPKIRSVLPNIDLFHSWDWMQPPDHDLPLVSTIHDLAILKYPETAHPKVLQMHRQSWEILKQRKATIIAVSRATKNDIVEHLDIPDERVHVIHEALPLEVKMVNDRLSEEQFEQIKKQLQLTRPFILFVGNREPRKNLKNLIDAWQPLQKNLDLIIAGESGWDDTENKMYQNLSDHLRFLGRVDDKQLSVLYAEAKLFAYPSLYEGFGLPILEAFHHGTPVVTSNVSSMPEVAGNAAELVDPLSAESIRAGIEKILAENTDQERQRLQKMIIRLQMFNWQDVITQTINVYQQTLANKQ